MLEVELFDDTNDSNGEDNSHVNPDERMYHAFPDMAEDDPDSVQIEFHGNAVTAINQCPTNQAKKLCLFNLDYKLQHSDHYDIGGTYNKQKPNLWFYCTTTICPGGNYILNIFVCHRNTGSFKISICNLESLIEMKDLTIYSKYMVMPKKFTTKIFNTSQIDKSYFIKSYCFSKTVVDNLHKILSIPIEIELCPKCPINEDLLRSIKLKHCFSGIFKRGENTDFTFLTKSGNKYDIHGALVATHSHSLEQIINTSKSKIASVDMNDDEMEILLDFLYMGGSDTEILDNYSLKLLDVAYRLKMEHVILLKQSEIIKNINVDNAIELAVLTEENKLTYMQDSIFEYIKNNPEVLETEAWKKCNNATLMKKLVEICKQKK